MLVPTRELIIFISESFKNSIEIADPKSISFKTSF